MGSLRGWTDNCYAFIPALMMQGNDQGEREVFNAVLFLAIL